MLREERYRLLGYKTPAHFYLEAAHGQDPATVIEFLKRLWTPALERAKGEAAEMQKLIDEEKGGFQLASWDWWYYAEKLRKAKYDLDDAALRPYFKLENVQQGMFTLGEKLYGLKFVERKDIPVYHPEVRVATRSRKATAPCSASCTWTSSPATASRAAPGPAASAAPSTRTASASSRFSTLVCNFTKPTAGTPSLLSIDEVRHFFHEFGHALNTLFTDSRYRSNFAPRLGGAALADHGELGPGARDAEALRQHYQTGEVIPAALVEKIKNSSLFNQGFETVEYPGLPASWTWPGTRWRAPLNVNVTSFEKRSWTASA